MTRRAGFLGAVILVLVALASGCASALGEPPEVGDLARAGGGVRGATVDPALLRAEASALLESRQDPIAVDRARTLYLEAAALDASCLECYLGAARAIAWLVEHEAEASRREHLAVEGVQVGQLCERAFPASPGCRYRLALAVGQQARERPSTASDGLVVMVEVLEQLIVEAPELDHAGPNRVLALVLLRAPGWPAGPGDPEYGLDNARAAVALFPDYPPNQLALGEALVENDQSVEGRGAYERALDLAAQLVASGHADAAEWRIEASEALADLE